MTAGPGSSGAAGPVGSLLAVMAQPGLLTGQGASAPLPGVLRFTSALARAGATAVVGPACPRCGRQRPLSGLAGGLRICGGCHGKARPVRCGRCGKVSPVARRNDGGQPICQSCRPGPGLACGICGSAGESRIGISRATGTPLCNRCRKRWATCSRWLNPDPAFWKRCASCRKTWQLSTAGCTRCRLDQKLRKLLTPPGGTIAPELDRLREALVRVDRPDYMLDRVHKPHVRPVLRSIASGQATTHEALDVLPPGGTLDHARALMVATGVLPDRDKRLTAREQWISQAIAGLADPVHRRVRPQADLDQWLAGTSALRARSANFVHWAASHRHASRLTAPATRWAGPSGPLGQDALAQRLHAIGISPRQGRSTALLALAAEVPAAILAKTLATHVQVAIQWQKISAGDWTAYAADVSRRSSINPGPAAEAGP